MLQASKLGCESSQLDRLGQFQFSWLTANSMNIYDSPMNLHILRFFICKR